MPITRFYQILQSYCAFLKFWGLTFKLFYDGNQPFVYVVGGLLNVVLSFTLLIYKLELAQLLGTYREKHKSKHFQCVMILVVGVEILKIFNVRNYTQHRLSVSSTELEKGKEIQFPKLLK
jgi:uncharacterized protein YhhL (DUF1145 family)